MWEEEGCPVWFQCLRLTPNPKAAPNPKATPKGPFVQLQAPARQLDHKLFQYAINALLGIYGEWDPNLVTFQ